MLGVIHIQDMAAGPSFPVLRGCSVFTGKGGDNIMSLPTGTVDGDLLVGMCETANEAVTTPTDWVEVSCSPQFQGATCPNGPDCVRVTMWTNEWATGENLTVTDAGNHLICGICSFNTGTFDTADHEDGCTGSVQPTPSNVIVDGTTTTNSFVRVLSVSSAAGPDTNSTTQFSNEVNAGLTELTELVDRCRNTGNGGCIFVADGKNETPDALPDTTADQVTAGSHANIMIGINPFP